MIVGNLSSIQLFGFYLQIYYLFQNISNILSYKSYLQIYYLILFTFSFLYYLSIPLSHLTLFRSIHTCFDHVAPASSIDRPPVTPVSTSIIVHTKIPIRNCLFFPYCYHGRPLKVVVAFSRTAYHSNCCPPISTRVGVNCRRYSRN